MGSTVIMVVVEGAVDKMQVGMSTKYIDSFMAVAQKSSSVSIAWCLKLQWLDY